MKILLRRAACVLLSIITVMSFAAVCPSAADYSGKCGENAFWSFDPETEILTISGSGKTDDYSSRSASPWAQEGLSGSIHTIIVENGITSIGKFAFAGTYVGGYVGGRQEGEPGFLKIADSVTEIGAHAFSSCAYLKTVDLPMALAKIDIDVFGDCAKLEEITLPASAAEISANAFSNCSALSSVLYAGTESDFEKIAVSSGNAEFTAANITYGYKYPVELNYYANGGTFSDGTEFKTITGFYGESAKFEGTLPTKQGNEFIGWAPAEGAITSREPMSFYASWKLRSYTITFYNGKEIYQGPDTYEYGAAIDYPADPFLYGHTFNCWHFTAGLTDLYIEHPDKMPAYDLTATAYFVPNTHSVSFYADGKLVESSDVAFGEKTASPVPSKTGYVFKGWDSAVPDSMPDYDLTFNAVFEPARYTIKLLCGGETVKEIPAVYDKETEIFADGEVPADKFSHFAGWALTPGGKAAVENGGKLKNLCTEDGGTVTLYAVTEPDAVLTFINYTATRAKLDYKASITFRAKVQGEVDGARIVWFVNGSKAGEGESFRVEKATAQFTVQAKYMLGNETVDESGVETVPVNTGFFAKLAAFFKGLFGKLPEITQ